MTEAEKIELIARAIYESIRDFERPVDLYIGPEAMRRWEKANPGGDAYDEPTDWKFESYRLIARSVLEALNQQEHP